MLLQLQNLSTHFYSRQGELPIVRQVSFRMEARQTLGIVGESGCGKTVLSLSLMNLLPPAGRIVSGELRFREQHLQLAKEAERLEALRGKEIAMIFQEPMSSLNPLHRIGDQITEAVLRHQQLERKKARQLALRMLQAVNMPEAVRRFNHYPHQLSGGLRQRVMIAMALVNRPKLLIADEPTTALDVTIQAQILELLRTLQRDNDMAILLISHDLGVIAEMADWVAVMYAGQFVEYGPMLDVFDKPLHPYTRGLYAALPKPGALHAAKRLPTIPGQVPPPQNLPLGCAFAARCSKARRSCHSQEPELLPATLHHLVRCPYAV